VTYYHSLSFEQVLTSYILDLDTGATAQDSYANRVALPESESFFGVADNYILILMADASGCWPWIVPDLADDGRLTGGLPLDEIQAAMYPPSPMALVPSQDPIRNPGILISKN